MNSAELVDSFSEFKEFKNIDRPTMMKVLEDVFKTLLRKKYGSDDNFDIIVNTDKGDLEIWRHRLIVEDGEVEDSLEEISITDAKKIEEDFEVGEEAFEEITLMDFGRRAILAARQTLISRILELEKDEVYKKYKDRIGEIVTTEVYQIWKREILCLDDDGNELILPKQEQIKSDYFKKGETIRAVVKDVEMRGNNPKVILSRTDTTFLAKLLEMEVPEIFDGLIVIKKIVREPGERAKVAVESYDDRIDPVGACVGMKGSRIHGIVRELKNENIDIINFTNNTSLFIQRALSPAKITSIDLKMEDKRVSVYLKPDQVSLAIGKGGLNIKFTRDAELDIDNDVSKSFLTAVETSLKKRKSADPLRFIHDEEMPEKFLNFLLKKIGLKKGPSVLPGVRYHNFKDFMGFPKLDRPDLWYKKLSQIPHPDFHECRSMMQVMKEKDVLLYYPYHAFDDFLDLLREAAIDPLVSHIRVNVYRVADQSNVIKSLVTAIRNGKFVTVVVELRARFDEAANIQWATKLREEGVRVITGVSGLKVHSKLCLITRREEGEKVYYGTIGTGNFHEDTSKVYTDHTLFTANQVITREVREIFTFFEKNYEIPKHSRLITAPFQLRTKIVSLINREIRNAKAGKRAELFFKMNSLVDEAMIEKLYQASKAGVKIKLIVRGICSLIPGIPKMSENIKAISLVDKLLEHTRVFVFHNDGKEDVYIGSADLMTRNLDYRVEVLCPILDRGLKQQLIDILDIQWSGNVKVRIFDQDQRNKYRKSKGKEVIRAQDVIHDYYNQFYISQTEKKD